MFTYNVQLIFTLTNFQCNTNVSVTNLSIKFFLLYSNTGDIWKKFRILEEKQLGLVRIGAAFL